MAKTCEYCMACSGERLWAEIHAPKDPASVFKMRPGWTFRVQSNKPLFEEGLDYIHADIQYGKGKKIEISIRKKAGLNDEFILSFADKQFVVMAEPVDKNHKREHGLVISEHDPFEVIDEA